MEKKKYPYLIGPSKRGYYTVQVSVKSDEAQEISDALATIRKMFPEGTMSNALKEGLPLADLTAKLLSRIQLALYFLGPAKDNPDVINAAMALTDCKKEKGVRFAKDGKSKEFEEWVRDE